MPPMVPCTSPHCWLRRGLPESNCSTVRLIRVWAGTFQIVEWIHWPWGFLTRYETHVGWSPYPLPIDPTVCTTRFTGAPAGCAEVKSTVGGEGRRNPMTAHTAKPAATMNSPITTDNLPPNDILHSHVLEGLVEHGGSSVPTDVRSSQAAGAAFPRVSNSAC